MDGGLGTEVRVFPGLPEASRALAEDLIEAGAAAVGRSGRFALAISGGSTPLPLFALLAGPLRDRVPWERTEVFWADERVVPVTDPRSNFGAARRLLGAVWNERRVHRIPVDSAPSESAAESYERLLRDTFPAAPDGATPTFDLLLLGMGPDGHTASLFPGSPVLDEVSRWVRAVPAPDRDPPVPRVTLTLPAIQAARRVAFLVSGSDKAEAFRRARTELRTGGPGPPAGRVRPAGSLTWYLDRDAAGEAVDSPRGV